MALLPKDWNVVVVGHWNRAILSPAWIGKRLFNLDEGTPVQVLVPLDVIAPYHIQHEDVTVIPGNDRLIVSPVSDTFENFIKAIKIIQRALTELPRTPVFAAGLNVAFKSETEIDSLQPAFACEWDDRLSDEQFFITSRSIIRSVKWGESTINVRITQANDGASEVSFNFDFKSQSAETLREWLVSIEQEIKSKVDLILHKTICLTAEEVTNA